MSIKSQVNTVTPTAGQSDAGQTAGIGASMTNTRRWQNFLSGRRSAPGPALLVIVATSVLLWAGIFCLLRTVWHFL
jgi:hypothetical protein